jgi:DNA mismatch endonuclease (patch repair protein)
MPRSALQTPITLEHMPARPWASTPAVRNVMRGNRKRDTMPELALRKALHGRGLRYRVAARPLVTERWTADVVFTRARVAVFVDGCFWHGCPDHFSQPRTNASYWGPKIARNRARDARVDADLAAAGWVVVRAWEHDAASDIAARVAEVVTARRRELDSAR